MPTPLLTAEAKRSAGAESGAEVVDMEGFWMARAVAEHGRATDRPVRFLALRVVLDQMDQDLPRVVETIIADGGRREWLHAARSALTNPLTLRRLVLLAVHSAQAQRALRRAVAALDPATLASASVTPERRAAP